MLNKVRKLIKEQKMIEPYGRVMVGVSGGADSVCLLLMLCALREELQFSVEVIHVEHGIRGIESKQDAYFTEELAKSHGCNENESKRVTLDKLKSYITDHVPTEYLPEYLK